MIPLVLPGHVDRPLRVLAIGAHADDIEIGCGGTLQRWAADRPDLALDWLVLSATGPRRDEAAASPSALLPAIAPRVTIHDVRDGYFPAEFAAVKDAMVAARDRHDPDIVLCHRREDAHQDHRLVGELAPQVFRDRLILEYEVPKWDGDLGSANVYVPLSEEDAERKIDHLLRAFPSQRTRSWFTPATFRATLRLRGIEAGSSIDQAEAFTCRKLVL
jgi:LmbE family N-acetylglucosaminyl deacetylase